MLNSLIQCAALELAPFGVRVNGVAPGMTDTNLRVTKDFNEVQNKQYLERMSSYFLLNKQVKKEKEEKEGKIVKQAVNPNDVANAIIFLASDEAKFMTGEILVVDNGYTLNHDLSFADTLDD